MFDIATLNSSSFRDVRFYTNKDVNTGGQRLAKHSFINGGTKTVSSGLQDDSFTIECFVAGDNYIAEKEALKSALNIIGTGTLVDRFYGEIEVNVDTFTITEDREKYGRADFKIVFLRADNKPLEVIELLVVKDITDDAFNYFQDNFINKSGNLALAELAFSLESFLVSIDEAIAFVDDSLQVVKDLKETIGRNAANVRARLISVTSLITDMKATLIGFTNVFAISVLNADEHKQFVNSLKTIQNGLILNTDNKVQAIVNEQALIYGSTMISVLNQIAIVSLEQITFTTGDDFGSVKDDTLSIYENLENQLSLQITSSLSINKIINFQNFLENLKTQRSEFISFYTNKYSRLQSLQNDDVVFTNDLLNYTMLKYNNINRIHEVMENNNIVDPIFIKGTLRVLNQ
jgi:prophage DNA circulation protein